MSTTTLKVGDTVTRQLGACLKRMLPLPSMSLKITEIDGDLIHCGPWTFSRKNGAEIDEELGWTEEVTGSFLKEFQI